jgi:CubicO group peptidase (beta-lactamase class C family)
VRQAFADGPGDNRMPGGAYHNQFWFPFPDSHAFLALGIHGQMIYMNPGANIVGVKFSSWGLPQDAGEAVPDDPRLRSHREGRQRPGREIAPAGRRATHPPASRARTHRQPQNLP